MNRIVVQVGALAFTAAMAASGTVLAQDGEASASASGGMALPGAGPAAAQAGDSSHDRMIGRLAIGYLGARTVQVGQSPAVNAAPLGVQAPVIGIRYWLDEMLGIDAGIGIGMNSGKFENDPGPPETAELLSTTAFLIHGGVPLSLASSGNFSFQIIPELNVGFASSSLDDADFSGSGFHLDIGARAGAEIHFGFIGIPELSLQGSVGLGLAMDSWKGEVDAAGATASSEGSSTTFGTSVQDNPWNIFTSNVSALYYF